MTSSEWVSVSTYVEALWPGKGWPDATLEVTGPAFLNLEARHVKKALAELFQEGREFPPSPSVVYATAEAYERDSRPALPPPDSIRELTNDERERSERWRGKLQAAITELAQKKTLGGNGQ